MTVPDPGVSELIVYATPTGELAGQCERFWTFARRTGSTTAQTYPPHVTLTGFFRRPSSQVESMVGELELARAAAPGPPLVEVVAVRYQRLDEGGGLWLGLEVRSRHLHEVVAALVASNDPGNHDRLRPKDWLHLSLAYGGISDLGRYRRAALVMVDPGARTEWELGLWERTPAGEWHQHCRHRVGV
ncbi:MAG: hypothetical protein GY929_02285 [Actinomycetia bacterium]|nr:hypothetical protein [Actinomycetes bacterium]